MTNAIKYTPDGGEISISAERAPSGRVKISVRDTGVGIAQENRHKVFAAFERIEDSYSSKQMGTGLGMPLTRKLAELNDGSVDFTSEPGKGSNFWVQLCTTEEIANQVEERQNAEKLEIIGRGEQILTVQKEGKEGELLNRALDARGFKVVHANELGEAMKLIGQSELKALVVDDQLTEQRDLPQIRQLKERNKIATVLITSRAFEFDTERYLKLGFDRCVAKPIRANELAMILREIIDTEVKIQSTPGPAQTKQLRVTSSMIQRGEIKN
jgi:ActR/RegA family two-component response regulator